MKRENRPSFFGPLKKIPLHVIPVVIAYFVVDEVFNKLFSEVNSIIASYGQVVELLLAPVDFAFFLWLVIFLKVNYSKNVLGIVPKESKLAKLTFRSILPVVLFAVMALLVMFIISIVSSLFIRLGLEVVGTIIHGLSPFLVLIVFLSYLNLFVFFTDYVMFENSARIDFGIVFHRIGVLRREVKGYRPFFISLVFMQLFGSALFVFFHVDYAYFGFFRRLLQLSTIAFQIYVTHLYCKWSSELNNNIISS